MPLDKCPWMAARCPHFRTDCNDADSVHCHYVKGTTRSAAALLKNLLRSKKVVPGPSPDMDAQIREAQDFLQGKMPPPPPPSDP